MRPLNIYALDRYTLMEISIVFALIVAGRWVEHVGHDAAPTSFASRELARRETARRRVNGR